MNNNSGFSTFELIIVIIVCGLVTAITIPHNVNSIRQERLAEIDAAFSLIETSLKVYKVTSGTYPIIAANDKVSGTNWNDIDRGDLTGKHYHDTAYSVESDGKHYAISIRGVDPTQRDLIVRRSAN